MTNAFFAVDLTDEARHALGAALTGASPGHPIPGKRPDPANWHITLRFLGPIGDETCDRVLHELDDACDVSPAVVDCIGLASFPKDARASVIFASIEDETAVLTRLAGICEEAARDVGLEPEERPFVPHLTLARLRPPRDVRSLFGSYGTIRVPIAVDAITLFRTVPGRNGVSYRRVDRIELVDG